MRLDRSKQRVMLEALSKVYPRFTDDVGVGTLDEHDLANLWYLKEQGLLDGDLEMSISQSYIFGGVRITAKGLDFLADDGGVSAILGTVTVKLHPDTIRDLLISRVEAAAPEEKKSWLKKQLETASNETVKKIVTSVLDEGIKRAPDIVRMIEKVIT